MASTASPTLPHAVMTMTGNAAVEGNDLRKQIETFLAGGGIARVVQVDQHRIVKLAGQRLAHRSRRLRGVDDVALGTKQQFDGLEDMGLIVGREDARRARSFARCRCRRRSCSERLLCVWALANVHSPGRDAIDRVLNLNSIIRQSRAGGAMQLDFRLLVGGVGVHQVELRQGEIALRGQRLEGRSRAQVLLLLHDGESLLGEVAGLARRLHTRAALLQCVLRVAHFDANLLLQLLLAKFCLAILQLGAVLISLGNAIANGNIQVQSDEVIRRRAVVGVVEGAPEIGGQR